ncbi:hypothetical protein BZA05DRAFT_390283 [Tricharina praecox]|uniref:uncharacterized protein n=1 Tax=Tricharina praecox TaxID=43433 RepID=UPI00221FBFB9|nr:uncharacterized protein BZA05DRAFT_390283 [Tricharina praecox]KAI5855996.1 hypothetical protein BZA05DRAFT_390283 [Tricharina praecox]
MRLPGLPQRRSYASNRLAKPTKFTPPSHPSRRPLKDPVHYPGPPLPTSATPKFYPETLPPPNTLSHRLLTSRRLHFYLSLGILSLLAGSVTLSNFVRTSPHAREIEWSWSAPGQGVRQLVGAWRTSVDEETRRVSEKRRRALEDVEKRGEYRKHHGLEETGDQGGFGGFGLKKKAATPELAELEGLEGAGGQGKEQWVEEELAKLEREAVGVVLPVREEKKKGGWW